MNIEYSQRFIIDYNTKKISIGSTKYKYYKQQSIYSATKLKIKNKTNKNRLPAKMKA